MKEDTKIYDIPPAKFVQQLKDSKENSQHFAYKHAFNDNGSRLAYDSFTISKINKSKYVGELFFKEIHCGKFCYYVKQATLIVGSLDGVFYKTYDIRG